MIDFEKHFLFMQKIYFISRNKINQEVPIVSIVVCKDKIVGKGFNSMMSLSNPNAHAEMIALDKASKKLNNFALKDSTIYISQEPCIMCIESIINYKIRNIVYASSSLNKNRWHYLQYLISRKNLDIVINIKENRCKKIIKKFFYLIR